MGNGWKVIWYEGHRKFMKQGFDGETPKASGALDYAKGLVARGILVANITIVSKRKAFAPPAKLRQPPERGMIWCPYCLKWRNFREFAIKFPDGLTSPAAYRCPICTISVGDHHVRRLNLDSVFRLERSRPTRTVKKK